MEWGARAQLNHADIAIKIWLELFVWSDGIKITAAAGKVVQTNFIENNIAAGISQPTYLAKADL